MPSPAGPLTALALVAVALLSGCAERSHVLPAPPRPLFEQAFANPGDALDAAIAAHAEHLRVWDEVLADGGAGAERLEAVSTGRATAIVHAEASEFTARGYRTSGSTAIAAASLQGIRQPAGPDTVEVFLYLCQDVTELDVLDETGASVVDRELSPLTGYQLEFSAIAGRLVLSDKRYWTGSEVC